MNMNTISVGGANGTFSDYIGNITDLYDLAKDNDPASRSELTGVIGSILEIDLNLRESELVADVLIKLMRQAEKDLRQVVSEQVAVLGNVPLRLILQISNDEIEIAKPVLTKSSVLASLDLMYIIKSKTSEYWQAIAERSALDDKVIDVLAETKDFDTALALAKNESIKLTQHSMAILSDIAQGSDILATPLLKREEVTSDIASALYRYVGKEIKAFIDSNYTLDHDVSEKVAEAIDRGVEELSEDINANGFEPDNHMVIAAQSFKDKNLLDIKLMLCSLRRGHVRSFVAQFSVYTGLPVETISEILSQSNGQGLAVVAKLRGIKKNDFISIFMLTSKIWNSDKLVGVSEIQVALDYFEKITPELAKKIMGKDAG